jgi:catechol 2,3-dioxygenase-like lactoylglutathione lyase family enzyme
MAANTATGINAILNVAVPVHDHDRALEFYAGILGFEIRRDTTFGPGMRWVEVAPAGAQTAIALAPLRDGASAGVDTGIRLATSDATATHSALKERGVDADAEILRLGPGVPPMFFVRDPDGNTLVVVEAPQA